MRNWKKIDDERRARAVEAFANHEIIERGDGRWTIAGRRDGKITGTGNMTICCLWSNQIFVGGDYDPIVFAYGPMDYRERLNWMGKHDDVTYYVRQKASIGTYRGVVDDFSADDAKEEILDSYREELSAVQFAELEAALEDVDSFDSRDIFWDRLWHNLPPFIDDLGEICDGAGMKVSWSVYYAWAAVRRLVELLEQEETILQVVK